MLSLIASSAAAGIGRNLTLVYNKLTRRYTPSLNRKKQFLCGPIQLFVIYNVKVPNRGSIQAMENFTKAQGVQFIQREPSMLNFFSMNLKMGNATKEKEKF